MKKSQKTPKIYAQEIENGTKLVETTGIDQQLSLKLARWKDQLDEVISASSEAEDWVCLVLHNGGGKVHRIDRRSPQCGARSVTILPNETSIWSSEGIAAFTHYYLSKDVLDHVASDLKISAFNSSNFDSVVGRFNLPLAELMESCVSTINRSSAPSSLQLENWAMLIADQLLRWMMIAPSKTRQEAPVRLDDESMARLVDYIESFLEQDVSLESLANTVSLSRYHFLRSFKQMTGKTPHQYVMDRRIKRAQERLVHSQQSIAEIAYDLGFSSQAHLTQVFRSRMGATPGKYREAKAS